MPKTYKNNGRYMVAHIIGEVKTHDTFTVWPPHITLLPWFHAPYHEAIHGFMQTVEDMESCRVQVATQLGSLAVYGDEKESVPVRQIEGEGAITLGVLHGLLLARFHDRLEAKQYIGGAYRPHVSIKKTMPEIPEEITVDSMCLIRHTGDEAGAKVIEGAERLRPSEAA